MTISGWGLVVLIVIVLAIVIEAWRQRRVMGRASGRPNLLGVGALELQRMLEPERKVEVMVQQARGEERADPAYAPDEESDLPPQEDNMIARIWHGWTSVENAERYRTLLEEQIFPEIAAKGVPGYRGIELLTRRSGPDEMEFVTVMWFDSWDAVKRFAGGEDYERAWVPPRAREVLARFDERSAHYELARRLIYFTEPGGRDTYLERP